MPLLTHIYNMPFTEVCVFIGSLEKSDNGSDWWWAMLQTAGAVERKFLPFPTGASFQGSRSRALCIPQQFIFCALLHRRGSKRERNAKSRSCALPFGFVIYFTLFYLNASEKALFKTFPSLSALSRSLLRGSVTLI